MLKILALAGGGLRGAFAIGVLSELEDRLGAPITDYFDLIAGTSTGAITAASLCKGISAAGVQAFYEKHTAEIFHPRGDFKPRRYYRPFYPLIRKYLRWRAGTNLDDFFQSRYCPFHLRDSMVDGFGEDTMSTATACRLVIPSVNLTDGVTCVFRTPHLPKDRPEYQWPIADIIVAATAAPTYFPHKTLPDGKDYADGGLWAIDPGVVGLAEAAKILDDQGIEPGSGGRLESVRMLSIGTGRAMYSLAPPGGDAGMLFWARNVADVMSISQVQGTQLPLSIVLGNRYRQIDFELEDETWTLDNLNVTAPLFEEGRQAGAARFDDLSPLFFESKTTPYTPRFPVPSSS